MKFTEHLPNEVRLLEESAVAVIAKLASDVEEGSADPIPLFLALRDIQSAVADAVKEVEPVIMDAVRQYGKEGFRGFGVKMSVVNGRRSFNYKGLPDWEELKAKIDAVEEEHKAAAIAAAEGKIYATEDGTVIDPAKMTFAKDSVRVELDKG